MEALDPPPKKKFNTPTHPPMPFSVEYQRTPRNLWIHMQNSRWKVRTYRHIFSNVSNLLFSLIVCQFTKSFPCEMARMILLNLSNGAEIKSQRMWVDDQEGDPGGRVIGLSGLGMEEREQRWSNDKRLKHWCWLPFSLTKHWMREGEKKRNIIRKNWNPLVGKVDEQQKLWAFLTQRL